MAATLVDASGQFGEKFGVPLTAAEEGEIERRLGVQRALGPAKEWASGQADSAGFYIDQQADGVPTFLFTNSPSLAREGLDSALASVGPYRVRQVEYSSAFLRDVQARVAASFESLRDEGINAISAGTRASLNRVVVGVVGLTDAQAKRLTELFGPGVVATDSLPITPDACTSRTNCPPMKGGLVIRSAADGSECTSGWLGKLHGTSTLRVLTAGHCIELGGGLNVNWSHNGSTFGQSKTETWANGAAADAGLISVSLSSNKNKFYASTATDIRGVTSYIADSQLGEGDFVCRAGRTSGYDCGHVTIPFADRNVDGKTLHLQTVVDFDSQPGDSGAPVFEDFKAYGVHTDSSAGCCSGTGWFSSMHWLMYELDVAKNVDWDLCMTSAC